VYCVSLYKLSPDTLGNSYFNVFDYHLPLQVVLFLTPLNVVNICTHTQ
jgi:hypothetical protein